MKYWTLSTQTTSRNRHEGTAHNFSVTLIVVILVMIVFASSQNLNYIWKRAISRVKLNLKSTCLCSNLRRLHQSKKNNRKIIVIGQIIRSGKIDSFRSIKSIQYQNFRNESMFSSALPIQNSNFTFINQIWTIIFWKKHQF